MPTQSAFLTQVLEKLAPHGPIKSRAMFGGYGIYYKEVIFAVIVENELYFRIDDKNRADYEKYDSKPFAYEGKNKVVVMPYLTLPEAVLKKPQLLKAYIEASYEASIRAKAKKRTPRKLRRVE
jgi:DNA transformation protein